MSSIDNDKRRGTRNIPIPLGWLRTTQYSGGTVKGFWDGESLALPCWAARRTGKFHDNYYVLR